jgi:hypothetical protein
MVIFWNHLQNPEDEETGTELKNEVDEDEGGQRKRPNKGYARVRTDVNINKSKINPSPKETATSPPEEKNGPPNITPSTYSMSAGGSKLPDLSSDYPNLSL